MNIVMAFLQLVTILMIAYFEYKKGSLSIFLWATLLVMFGLPHFVSVLFGLYDYEPTVMMLASVFVILFNFVYLVVRVILIGRNEALHSSIVGGFKDLGTEISFKNKVLIGILFLNLFACAGLITYYSRKMFGGVLDTSWGKFYAVSSSAYDLEADMSLIPAFSRHLLFASSGVVIPLWIRGKRTSAFLAMVLIMYYAFITRNKITILPVLVTPILIYMSKNRRIRARQIVFFCFAGAFVIYFVYALQVFRRYGTIREFLMAFTSTDFNRHIFEMMFKGGGELGLRNVFYYFLSHNNKFPDFGKGHSYVRLLLIAIPQRYSLGLKPRDFAVTMGSAYANDFSNTTFSTHPTLYGDCYANLWWYGILLGIFWAFFVLVVDRIVNRKNAVTRVALMVLFGCTYVIIGRGSVYNGTYLGFICGMYLFFLNFVLPARIRQQARDKRSLP